MIQHVNEKFVYRKIGNDQKGFCYELIIEEMFIFSDAARECRRKKKEYIKCLEERVTVLENQNKALIEELRQLKELYCQREETNNKTTSNNNTTTNTTTTSGTTR